jgi:hypothetical protein
MKIKRSDTDEERAIARAEYDADLAWLKTHNSNHPDWSSRARRPLAPRNRPDVFTDEEMAADRAESEEQDAWAEAQVAAHEAEHPHEERTPILTIKLKVDFDAILAEARAKKARNR